MTKKPKKCPACERGDLVSRETRATMPFRHAPSVAPAWAVMVPTCTACGERFVDSATAKAWDEALAAGLAELQRRLVGEAISRLTTVRLQREWEKRLALSPGYLSRLKAGKETSVPLVTLLAMLAEAPAASWERVGQLWSDGAEVEPELSPPSIRLVHSQEFATTTVTSTTPFTTVSAKLSPVRLGDDSNEAAGAAA